MITYLVATTDDLSKDVLQEYERYSKTTMVYYVKHNQLLMKPDTFVDDWNLDTLTWITNYLRDCILRGGTVILAKDNDRVIGFTNIETTLYLNIYINMPYLHVSRSYRGRHIGQELFQRILPFAKKLGAKALYISAHPSVETQRFYEKMGCVLAQTIIPELYEKEPLDIQLEKVL